MTVRVAGRPGRGERARVAAQVRSLVSGFSSDDPAARTTPIPRVDEPSAEPVAERAPWLPGNDFVRHVPGHATSSQTPRLRWNPGRRGAAALGLLVVVVVACTGWWFASARPQELPITSASPVSGAPSGGAGSPAGTSASSVPASSASAVPHGSDGSLSSSAARLVIDVAGKVRRPGVYLLPPGSRVYDALRAAGGVRPGVSTVSLNLAAALHDGEQVVVGPPGAPQQPGAATDPATGSSTAAIATIVDLNTATLEQLETLPGVGPVLGQHILDWRDAHGPFTSIDQLQDVSGIGPSKFAAMKDLVTV